MEGKKGLLIPNENTLRISNVKYEKELVLKDK
jgi:hypothetical protein